MPESDVLQSVPLATANRFSVQRKTLKAGFLQLGGEDEQSLLRVHKVVREFRVHVQRLVGGKRPGRRSPDHGESWLVDLHGKGAAELLGFAAWKADVDRRILALLVFDLGLRQGRSAVEAPVHRLEAPIDIALLQ